MSEKELQNFETQQKIQRYVSGELSDSERTAFEAEVQSNADLEAELRFSQDLVYTLKNKEQLEVNSILKDAIADVYIEPDFDALKDQESGSAGSGFSKWLLSGVVIIGLAVGGMFVTSSGLFAPSETALLVQEYLEPFENLISPPEGGALAQGMMAYDQGDYKSATQLLSAYVQNNTDPQARFYLGVSQLLDGQLAPAISNLEILAKAEDLPQKAAQWYLALAYLKNDEIKKATPLIEGLKDNGVFGPKAQPLLQKLQALNPNI